VTPDTPAVAKIPGSVIQPVHFEQEEVPLAQALPAVCGISLQSAIETSLEQSPDLVALRSNYAVSQAAMGVAQTYPFNPYVQMQVLPYGRHKNGDSTSVSHYVLLMQTLELAHQRRYREGGALANIDKTHWTIHQAELTNVAQTERLFCAAAYQREVRDQLLEIARLNEEFVAVLQRRFATGQSLDADVTVAHVQAIVSRQQAQLAEANYRTATLELAKQIAVPICGPLDVADSLSSLVWEPVGCSTTNYVTPDGCAECRPDVLAARADVRAAEAALDLADASRRPNLITGPIYERDDAGTVLIGLRAQMDIPVLNTGRPLVAQRETELHARQETLTQLQTKVRLDAGAALERYEHARQVVEQCTHSREELAAQMRRMTDAFNAGQIDYVRVMNAKISAAQAARARLDLLNELAQAAAGVTASCGLSMDVFVHAPPCP
jgi:outer membrane protein TolC